MNESNAIQSTTISAEDTQEITGDQKLRTQARELLEERTKYRSALADVISKRLDQLNLLDAQQARYEELEDTFSNTTEDISKAAEHVEKCRSSIDEILQIDETLSIEHRNLSLLEHSTQDRLVSKAHELKSHTTLAGVDSIETENLLNEIHATDNALSHLSKQWDDSLLTWEEQSPDKVAPISFTSGVQETVNAINALERRTLQSVIRQMQGNGVSETESDSLLTQYINRLQHRIFTISDSLEGKLSGISGQENYLLYVRSQLDRLYGPLDEQPDNKSTLDQLENNLATLGQQDFLKTLRTWRENWQDVLRQGGPLALSDDERDMQQQAMGSVVVSLDEMLEKNQQQFDDFTAAQQALEDDHDWLLTTLTEPQLSMWREHQITRLMSAITNNTGSELTTKQKYELAHDKTELVIEQINTLRDRSEDEDNYHTIEKQWQIIGAQLATELAIGEIRWHQRQREVRLQQLEQQIERQHNDISSQTETAQSESNINTLRNKIADIKQYDARLSEIFDAIEKQNLNEGDDEEQTLYQLRKDAKDIGDKAGEAMEQLEDAHTLQRWQNNIRVAQKILDAETMDPFSQAPLRAAYEQHLQFHELYCAGHAQYADLELKVQNVDAEHEQYKLQNSPDESGQNTEHPWYVVFNTRGARIDEMPPALKSLTEFLFETEVPAVWDKASIYALEVEREWQLRSALPSARSDGSDEDSIKSIKERLAEETNPQLKNILNNDGAIDFIQRELDAFEPPKKLDEIPLLKLWATRLHAAVDETRRKTPITWREVGGLIQQKRAKLASSILPYDRMLGEQRHQLEEIYGDHLSDAMNALNEQPQSLLPPNTSSARHNTARQLHRIELNRILKETSESLSTATSLFPPGHATIVALQKELKENHSLFATHIDVTDPAKAQEDLEQQLQHASHYLAQPRNAAISEKFRQDIKRVEEERPSLVLVPLEAHRSYRTWFTEDMKQYRHYATTFTDARKSLDTLVTDITSEGKRLRKDEEQRAILEMRGEREPGFKEQNGKWEKLVASGRDKAITAKKQELLESQRIRMQHAMRAPFEKAMIERIKKTSTRRFPLESDVEKDVSERFSQSLKFIQTQQKWQVNTQQIDGDINNFVSDQTTGANLAEWLKTSKVEADIYIEVLDSTLVQLKTLQAWNSNEQPLPHLLKEMSLLKETAENHYKNAAKNHVNELINGTLPALQKQLKMLAHALQDKDSPIRDLEETMTSLSASLHSYKQHLEQPAHTMEGEQLKTFSDEIAATYARVNVLQHRINLVAYDKPDILFQHENRVNNLMQEHRNLFNSLTPGITTKQSAELETQIAGTRASISDAVTTLPPIWLDRIAILMHENNLSMHQRLQEKFKETEEAFRNAAHPSDTVGAQLADIKANLERNEETLRKLRAAVNAPAEKFSAHLQEWLHESESVVQTQSKMDRELKNIRQQIPGISDKAIESFSQQQPSGSPAQSMSGNESSSAEIQQPRGVKRKRTPDETIPDDTIKGLISAHYEHGARGWTEVSLPRSGVPSNSTLVLTHPLPCTENDLQLACIEVSKGITKNGIHQPAKVAIVHARTIPEHNIKEIVDAQKSNDKTISGFSLKNENKIEKGIKRSKSG